MRRTILLASIAATASLSWGQGVIAARAGMIHYSEGAVNLDGQPLASEASDIQEFKFIKDGETLNTTRGRSEILLNPGTFLRLAENSSVRLVSSTLEDTHVLLLSGKALIEVSEANKDNLVVVQVGSVQARLDKRGLYQFSAEPARLRVYDGEASLAATVDDSNEGVRVRSGKEANLNVSADQIASIQTSKFDKDETDALYRWSARRDRVTAQVNQSSALLASNTGYGYQGQGYSNWIFNPAFGMYTFLPGSGYGYSPFSGIQYYSPVTIVYLTQPLISTPATGINSSQLAPANASASSGSAAPTRSAAPAAAAPVSAPAAAGGRKR